MNANELENLEKENLIKIIQAAEFFGSLDDFL
jgi:hypothetical protein